MATLLMLVYSFAMLTIGPGLLSTSGIRHKKQRKILSPVFSGAHMRNLTPIFHEVAQRVRRRLHASPHHTLMESDSCHLLYSSKPQSKYVSKMAQKRSTLSDGWAAPRSS